MASQLSVSQRKHKIKLIAVATQRKSTISLPPPHCKPELKETREGELYKP